MFVILNTLQYIEYIEEAGREGGRGRGGGGRGGGWRGRGGGGRGRGGGGEGEEGVHYYSDLLSVACI